MHVGVVVPARDEQAFIARCLDALAVARERVTVPVTVVVVADSCDDATAEVASSFADVIVRRVNDGNVGAARSVGSRIALDQGCTWLAHTDADSVVPPHWIHEQVMLANAGYDVIVGTVRPDFADLSAAHVEQWRATHERGKPNGHVHGANLGVRAATYRSVGGFAHLAEHEDNDLVDRLVAMDAAIIASDRAEVMTSGRLQGRTAGGYAGYLRQVAADLEITQWARGEEKGPAAKTTTASRRGPA
ncbi:MAG: glycosyltransferase [Microcella sp.]|uniref:glycosyltransferase n=1 Tax=Microcella sp. TaxID=1913979 RepID=UPI0024CD1274|nr:glycosyltransferase [Microcella sp.]UYN83150.1 MAG: glycosyltransferase [Microcella sp.]